MRRSAFWAVAVIGMAEAKSDAASSASFGVFMVRILREFTPVERGIVRGNKPKNGNDPEMDDKCPGLGRIEADSRGMITLGSWRIPR
ncbi:hypothetical protein HAHE_23360 [Haloferula helveola]|uniref:Secreted protein n=1 Tax=Haloferula helveola TaxID=490095 RepID=A0ABN6H921_9BACT|nr:hypothetical protein HAHE_23360 [Haloferula helveola]